MNEAEGYPQGAGPYYPPSGTYPAPYEQPIYNTNPPPEPEAPRKTRRVGTITMAVCLIAVGVVLALAVFLPAVDLILFARLAPLVLVLLGAEILIAHIRHRDEKLRYDVLSVIICIVLICCSIGAALVPAFYHRTIDYRRTSNRLEAQLQEEAYERLDKAGFPLAQAEWYVELEGGDFSTDMAPEDIAAWQYVQVHLYLNDEFEDADAFTAACQKAADALEGVAPHVDYATFNSGANDTTYYEGAQRYYLGIDSNRLFQFTAGDMAARVNTEYWVEQEGYYVDEWEHADRLAHPEDYADPSEEDEDFPAEEDTDPLASRMPTLKNGLEPDTADTPAAA